MTWNWLMMLYGNHLNGRLPMQGGVMEQPYKLMRAFMVLDGVRADIEDVKRVRAARAGNR
jgi:hypothetical protein